jgi:hypothetical protein
MHIAIQGLLEGIHTRKLSDQSMIQILNILTKLQMILLEKQIENKGSLSTTAWCFKIITTLCNFGVILQLQNNFLLRVAFRNGF